MVNPTIRSPRVRPAPSYERTSRKTRRPQHRFNLRTQPYQIQPFMIAPVLPGETMKTAMLQSQIWSDPLASGTMKNIGWWCEYFFFYVKHRDLTGYEETADGLGLDMIKMFTENLDLSAHQEATRVQYTYTPPGGVDFLGSALQRIVNEYFRDEGEPWDIATLGGVPLAKIYGKGASDWAEKLTLAADYEDRRVALDVDGDGTITVDEIDRAYVEWAAARDAGLMDMDYEDWMRTYGASSTLPNQDRVDHHRPEVLGHFRDFTYPTNTVEPTNGVPATAVGWRMAQRLSKAFFMQEPGWIIGLQLVRPKVYLGAQEGSIASMMQTREAWLPAVLNDQLNVSHLNIPPDTGPLSTTITAAVDGNGYWLDLRDLLNFGDQFVNWAPESTDAPFVALPVAPDERRYVTETDIAKFWATEGNSFQTDGLVSLSILGRQQETGKNLVLGRA